MIKNFPCDRQMDVMDCGPACLKIKELWEQRGDIGIVNRHRTQQIVINA